MGETLAEVDLSKLAEMKPFAGWWQHVAQLVIEFGVVGLVVWVVIWFLTGNHVAVPGETWWWVLGVPLGLNVLYLLLRTYKPFGGYCGWQTSVPNSQPASMRRSGRYSSTQSQRRRTMRRLTLPVWRLLRTCLSRHRSLQRCSSEAYMPRLVFSNGL